MASSQASNKGRPAKRTSPPNTIKPKTEAHEFEAIDPEIIAQVEEQVERHIIARFEKMHSGPLHAPEDFAKYENILPGAAERILSMAENEARHRHTIDNG